MNGKRKSTLILSILLLMLFLSKPILATGIGNKIWVIMPKEKEYIVLFNSFKKQTQKLHNFNFIIKNEITEDQKIDIITIGSKNTQKYISKEYNSLFFFLVIDPNIYAKVTEEEKKQNISGIFYYPSPEMQLKIMTNIFPNIKNIAIICSEKSLKLAQYIYKLGRRRGKFINIYKTDLEHYNNCLKTALQENGIIWMIPDQDIYTPITIKRTLLSGIKLGIPVWSFSTILLNAGAFGSFKIDNNEYCKEAAKIFYDCTILHKCKIEFTQKFKIILNKNLIDFWGIKIPKETQKEVIIR